MKRAIVIIMLAVLLSVSLCGCVKAEAGIYRFQTLEMGLSYDIYVDTLTGVQYLQLNNRGVCVVVDAEGRPLIWEGYYDKNSSR